MKITLNIGLNIGDKKWTKQQALEQVKVYFMPEHYKVSQGEYNGKPESTLIVSVFISGHKELSAINDVQKLCVTLQQDCIALKIGEDLTGANGTLVYHPRYKGERQAFKNELFIHI